MLGGRQQEKMVRLVENFGGICRRMKLEMNVAKSKVMQSVSDGIVGEINIRDGLLSVRGYGYF